MLDILPNCTQSASSNGVALKKRVLGSVKQIGQESRNGLGRDLPWELCEELECKCQECVQLCVMHEVRCSECNTFSTAQQCDLVAECKPEHTLKKQTQTEHSS